MTVQVFSATGHITSRAVRRIIGRCALAAVGASLGAISVSAAGAPVETGYSRTVALPPYPASAGRRSIPAHPIDAVEALANRTVLHADELVDRLYDEVMHSSECALMSSKASTGRGC